MIVYIKIMIAKFTSCKWQRAINYLMEGRRESEGLKGALLCQMKMPREMDYPQVYPERENMAGFVLLILKEIWETINIKEIIAELPNFQEKTNRISIN